MNSIQIQVFLVETGTMYYVDASLNQCVAYLKETIAKNTRIPVEKQVLVLSGGVPLFSQKQLWQYESVSDNIVFLVCKTKVEDIARPVVGGSSHSYSDQDLMARLEASIKLPAALETVQTRMLLVERICEMDVRELQDIRQLVFDQHLQQQGWAAVLANLDEVCNDFQKRVQSFSKRYGEYMKVRENTLVMLRRMPQVLVLLEKTPMLGCLKDAASRLTVSLRGAVKRENPFTPENLTLYSWMNAQNSRCNLEKLIEELHCGIVQLGEQLEEWLDQETKKVWECTEREKMRSISGIEARLFGLDKLIDKVKVIVDMQISTREGFRCNWARLKKEKDGSILPDLCDSHSRQIQDLLVRHKNLLHLKRKCVDTKRELCMNLQSRLEWLMYNHWTINGIDSQLIMHNNLLKRIQTQAQFLQQVEQAPEVYALMVVEVVRRRLFSEYYMKWSTGVATESKKEYKKETRRRRMFSKQCGSHFLHNLFEGFIDNVPKFALEVPKDVDHELPEITPADITWLSKEVPELQSLLKIPTDTGSPAVRCSTRQAQDDIVTDPFMIETAQSMASSSASFITRSITSTTQSVSEAFDPGSLLLGERGERDKLSLSYQGGERWREVREQGEGKDPLFLSLQEKFAVPQCLSETLTAEVNSAAISTISVSIMAASPQSQEFSSAVEELGQMQQQQPQHPEGGGDGVLLSSGDLEPTKSSDSDVISHESLSEHKPRSKRRSVKALSDTSPDAETSQEFATADFYIEDSMPSSIADSPPKPSGAGKDQGEMGAVLAEKAKRVDELEGKVSALQSKLVGSQEKLASLHSLLNSDVSSLRESLGGLRDSVQHSEGQMKQSLAQAGERVGRTCSSLVETLTREREEVVRREREESRQVAEEVEAKYQAKCQKMEDLQQSIGKMADIMADLKKDLERQQEKSQRDAEGLKERHEEEMTEIRRQNLLEVELETDRIRTEMQGRLDQQDAHVQGLLQQLEQTRTDLAQALTEKEAMSQTLVLEFEVEKRQLQESLQAEKSQALAQAHMALMEESRKETESLLHRESSQRELQMQQQLEELKLAHEKQLTDKEEELKLAFEKQLMDKEAELKSAHEKQLTNKEAELKSAHEKQLTDKEAELKSAHEKQLTDKEAELKSAHEKLLTDKEAELKSAHEKQLMDKEAELKSAHEKHLADKKAEQRARHEAELASAQDDWSKRLATQETDLQVEFDLKLERVRAEFEAAASTPEVRELGVQSGDLSSSDQGTQCEAWSVSVSDREAQSEVPEVRDSGAQWDRSWGVEGQAVQTDQLSVMERQVQSDSGSDVCDQITQSERLCVGERGVQSDPSPGCEQAVQSDVSVLSEQGTQSDGCFVSEQSVQSEGDESLLPEKHQEMVLEAVNKTREQVSQQYEQMLADERQAVERRVTELKEQHQRDKEEAVQNCRSSVLAERQISINEVIDSAVKEKDSVIEELRAKLNTLIAQGGGGAGESEGESQDLRKQLANIKEKESCLKHEKRRLENEVCLLQQQLHQYSEQFQSMTASAAPVSLTPDKAAMTRSCTDEAVAESLEQEACAKDKKISDLEKKLMEMSMTTSIRKEVRDKVSILTCHVGDLVLLCLDERHDQYVVFTVGTTLHFLHSDCVDLLGLRPAEGEARKNWVLAEVTEREYCQARKAQNRFKVPVNTKFYRVKAKPWMPRTSLGS